MRTARYRVPLGPASHTATMQLAWTLLACCCLVLSAAGGPSKDFCLQNINSSVKPGFPKTIKTNNPGVLKAARHTAERFNNCTNDIFLFKESHINRALVQIVKGLKYMLNLDIGRTTCKKTRHPSLDKCDFQTNRTLTQTFSCYSEVWVVPWLHKVTVLVLLCH
ncbi:cystatin-F [Elephas maximus indicus]|uniref:cystatin-F n=1 Tax=Elephas maximus indicus TaxID=99487 RepID=UPI002115EB42|nr:cystatin-F [Elephas maximus indicus]